MKRYATIFLIVVFVSLVLWMSMPAQQVYKQTAGTKNLYARQIDTLQLRIKQMEKELAELRKVIKITGGNVEIKSLGTLELNGSNLSVKSLGKLNIKGTKLNMEANTMALQSSSQMTLKSSLIKLN